jgi:hypothetical protein
MTERDDRSAKPGSKRPLTPAAERALAEAAERRVKRQVQEAAQETAQQANAPKEVGGPSGPEPTRYGDWEKKGLTSDF